MPSRGRDRFALGAPRTRTREPASVRGTPQWTTTTATPCGIATGVTELVAAVDQQRVPGAAEQRRELVHEPTGHAGGLGLGGEREPGGVDRSSGSPARRRRVRG